MESLKFSEYFKENYFPVSVNFMTQKLTLSAADERFGDVLDRVVALTAKMPEPALTFYNAKPSPQA